jgi:hypothetical protein
MALEIELATYHKNLPALLEHEGKFVVIGGEVVSGFWDTYEDALRAGYGEFGLDPFMVKQVLAVEPVHYISRGTPVCPS